MGTVQSTYLDRAAVAYVGMIKNTEPNVLISRTVETAAIGFGVAVKQGVADHGVLKADDTADVYRGITVRDQSVDPAVADVYAVGENATIMTKGVVYVTLGATVAAGAAAYMIDADDTFTSSAGGNLAIPNAVFDGSGVSGDIVPLRLN